MKYRAVKINGFGECVSNNIDYIIENVENWCGQYFDLYVDDVKVDDPREYLERHKKRTPVTLEEKIVDMCFKNDSLQEENKRLKEEINKISKKELKVRDMLYSIENGTLTRERLMQIEEVLFEIGGERRMSKWKCDICGEKFDNFHAQGFDGKVYCPLCFFKEENRRLKKENEDLREKVILLRASEPMLELEKYYGERDLYKEVIEEVREYINKNCDFNGTAIFDKFVGGKKILQILDKAKED